MSSPAKQPPARLDRLNPKEMQKTINELIDYVRETHIDAVDAATSTDKTPQVQQLRAGSGTLLRIKTGAGGGAVLTPPSSGLWVLGASGGSLVWIGTTSC